MRFAICLFTHRLMSVTVSWVASLVAGCLVKNSLSLMTGLCVCLGKAKGSLCVWKG